MKPTIISILVAIVLIGGAFALTQKSGSSSGASANNVTVVDGKQIVEISAKGGYHPRTSIAKAGIPTIIS